MPQDLLLWIVAGVIGGYLASTMAPEGGPGGLVGDLVIGVAGAYAGCWLLGIYLAQWNGQLVARAAAAGIGAFVLVCIVTFIANQVSRFRQ